MVQSNNNSDVSAYYINLVVRGDWNQGTILLDRINQRSNMAVCSYQYYVTPEGNEEITLNDYTIIALFNNRQN